MKLEFTIDPTTNQPEAQLSDFWSSFDPTCTAHKEKLCATSLSRTAFRAGPHGGAGEHPRGARLHPRAPDESPQCCHSQDGASLLPL